MQIRVVAGALAAVVLAVGCTSCTAKTAAPAPSPTPVATHAKPRPSTAPTTSGSAALQQEEALQSLGDAGLIECKKHISATGDCTTDADSAISKLDPRYGFTGPFATNFGGAWFHRSTTNGTDWKVIFALGEASIPCSGSYPVPTAILKELAGCY